VKTEFWWEELIARDHLDDPGAEGKILLKEVIKK
jgi:hypothetical protein